MQIFRNRPLAFAECLFAVTAVLCFCIDAELRFLLLPFLLLLLAGCLARCILSKRSRRNMLLLLLCVLFMLSAVISSVLFFDLRYSKIESYQDTVCEIEGVVTERLDSAAYYSRFYVRLDTVNGEPMGIHAMVECTYPSALQLGDRFSMTATARPFSDEELFDERNYLLSKGILTVMKCESAANCVLLPETQGLDAEVLFSKWNETLSSRLYHSVGRDGGGLSVALLLGNRDYLSADDVLAFRRVGISHLLALSGLHVSILIGAIETLLRKLRVPNAARAIVIPLAALGYVALTGFSVSTWRAALMTCVLYVGWVLRSRYDSFTALCTVLVAILLVSPYAVCDISLWLSFLAAASIIVFSPAVMRFLRTWREKKAPSKWLFRVIQTSVLAVTVGFVANLAILLLSTYYFGELSLLSIPATCLLSLPISLSLILSALLLFVPIPILCTACNAMESGILRWVDGASHMENILIPTLDTVTIAVLTALTAVLVFFAVVRLKRPIWSILLPILCVCGIVSSFCAVQYAESGSAHLTTIEAGSGEVRLYTERGYAVLVNDTSGAASGSFGIYQAALGKLSTEIGDMVLCRYYNQATYFIAQVSSEILVRRLHLPLPQDAREEAIAYRLQQEAEVHGIEVLFDAESILSRYP